MAAKILIVEDNELNMRLFSDLLKSRGYEVRECLEAKEAMPMLHSFCPDLVLMDIQMPEISGLELLRKIRNEEDPRFSKVKIIAVTAFAMKGDEEKMLENGSDDYIAKPIAIHSFLSTVSKNLSK